MSFENHNMSTLLSWLKLLFYCWYFPWHFVRIVAHVNKYIHTWWRAFECICVSPFVRCSAVWNRAVWGQQRETLVKEKMKLSLLMMTGFPAKMLEEQLFFLISFLLISVPFLKTGCAHHSKAKHSHLFQNSYNSLQNVLIL